MAAEVKIKLDKTEAKKGDIVEVKALVYHPTETGLRKDKKGIRSAQASEQVHLHGGRQGGFLGRFRHGDCSEPFYPLQIKAFESGPVVDLGR